MLETVQDYIDAKLCHSIHTSGAKSFRQCRRRWNWLTREYYYPKVTAKPLEFGVAFHVGMETLYSPRLWDKPEAVVVALAQQAFLAECKKQFDKYALDFEIDDEVTTDYEERKVLGKGMLKHFAATIRREDILKGYKPLYMEIKFEVPLEDSGVQMFCKCDDCWGRWCEYVDAEETKVSTQWIPLAQQSINERDLFWNGLPVTYGGRIDCLMTDDEDNVWVVDWKSAARMIEDRDEFLDLDDQIVRYLAAMRISGYEVAGFLYQEIKKAVPTEPEPMKVRRKGCMYSVSKQQAVQYDTYLRVVKEYDYDAYQEGCYNEYLAWLRENEGRFSARYEKRKTVEQLELAWANVIMEAKEIINPELPIYPNAGRFSCEYCAFKVPCTLANEGGDVLFALDSMFDKKKRHYFEDESVPSTDSQFGVIIS